MNKRVKINVRFGEWLDPREFVRPRQVEELAAELMLSLPEQEAVLAAWGYVCEQINYPPDDHHSLGAFTLADLPFFGRKYLIRRSTPEFWQYPSETLDWKDDDRRYGDCEDTSVLLCSLLRNFIPAERVWVVVGEVPAGRHAWVELDGQILETTLSSAPNPTWRSYSDYVRAWAFNDIIRVGEIVFVPKADEREKLRWIAARWGHPTKL